MLGSWAVPIDEVAHQGVTPHQPSGAASGAPIAACKEEATTRHDGDGLPRLSCLGLKNQAGTAAQGEGGHEGDTGGGAAKGTLEVHGLYSVVGLGP
jgi:hypothetical protein